MPSKEGRAKFWAFLPKPIKQWLKAAGSVLGTLAVLSPFSPRLAIGLAWSFIYAEAAIAWWIKLGISLSASISIALICGSISTYGWVWLAYHPEAPPLFKKFWDWAPPGKWQNSRMYKFAQKTPYLAIPVISWFPDGGVWLGIAICKFLRVKKSTTFILVTLGNAVKMISWGYGFTLMPKRAVVWAALFLMLTFFGIGIYRYVISKRKAAK